MEISVMIANLKAEATSLDERIRALTDRKEAVKMAIESLELLQSTDDPIAVVEEEKATEKPVRKTRNPGKPKRVVQKDEKGTVLREYRSVNQAAKSFGWTYAAMTKYLNTTSREKQIKLRGYYLAYAQ